MAFARFVRIDDFTRIRLAPMLAEVTAPTGRPSDTYPLGNAPPQPSSARRGPVTVLAIAATVLILLAGGAVLWGLLRAPDPVTPANTDLSAVVDFRATQPAILERSHQDGLIAYTVTPPVGGVHNPRWQNCMGDVYSAPIPPERAVHSLEHGAVWITYDPAAVDAATIAALATKVRGKQYLLMSPYPGQASKISIQAWGYQLALSVAGDPRLDGFIYRYRIAASMEPGAPCSGGETSATL